MLVLTFQIGSDRLALDVRRVREVVPRVRFQHVAGSPPWLAGLFVGLLAAQVADVREVQPGDEALPSFHAPGQPDLGLTLVDEGGILHLLDLDALLPEALQRMVTHLPGDA